MRWSFALVIVGCGAAQPAPPAAAVAPLPRPDQTPRSAESSTATIVRSVHSEQPLADDDMLAAVRRQATVELDELANTRPDVNEVHLDITVRSATRDDTRSRVVISMVVSTAGPPERIYGTLRGAASVMSTADIALVEAAEGAVRGAFRQLPQTLDVLQ